MASGEREWLDADYYGDEHPSAREIAEDEAERERDVLDRVDHGFAERFADVLWGYLR